MFAVLQSQWARRHERRPFCEEAKQCLRCPKQRRWVWEVQLVLHTAEGTFFADLLGQRSKTTVPGESCFNDFRAVSPRGRHARDGSYPYLAVLFVAPKADGLSGSPRLAIVFTVRSDLSAPRNSLVQACAGFALKPCGAKRRRKRCKMTAQCVHTFRHAISHMCRARLQGQRGGLG